MNSSENLNELFKGLAAFHKNIEQPKKTASNPFFKSNYVTLECVQNAIDKAIEGTGLSYLQFVKNDSNGGVSVTTVITHSSGQWLSSGELTLTPTKKDPQGYGSAITYEKRYQLASMFGISSDIDDDANAGTFGTTKRTSNKNISQQSQARQAKSQQVSPQQQMIKKATLEFNNLKRQLMQQQNLTEEQIRNIALQASQGVDNKIDRLIVGNEALKQMLGEMIND